MAEDRPRATDPSARAETPNGRLDSWKEIGAYLKRDVTTVRRWEKREGLPVHRHLGERGVASSTGLRIGRRRELHGHRSARRRRVFTATRENESSYCKTSTNETHVC